MACGTPVVASDTTSIPELVGDAALLCPPGDVEAFAAALRRLRTEAELADDLRRRGLARAAEFTWERTARAARGRRRGGRASVIVFVHGLRNWGAVEEYVAALVRGLRARGEDVALLYPDDAALAPFAELGAAGGTFDLDAAGADPAASARAATASPDDRPRDGRLPSGAARRAARRSSTPARHPPHARAAAPRQRRRASLAAARLVDAARGDLHVGDGSRRRRSEAPLARRPARHRARALRKRHVASSTDGSSATSHDSPSRRASAT